MTELWIAVEELMNKYSNGHWGVLVFLNLCKILVSARFCGVCAR